MSTTNTGISWTDRTWNPVRGCSRVSAGCDNCYAMGQAHRFAGAGQPYEGLTTIRRGKVDWVGSARLVPAALAEPLKWRKPQRVFVNSMSDLFHESLSNDEIAAVFGVMAAAPQHTFQVLTKRPKRMRAWFKWVTETATDEGSGRFCYPAEACRREALGIRNWHAPDGSMPPGPGRALQGYDKRWPLPNVHLGVSVEDQKTVDERIPLLLETPAVVRFISAEPLLGPIDLRYACFNGADSLNTLADLHWVITGGESGVGARQCATAWISDIVNQCRLASVPCFVKQLGSNYVDAVNAVGGALAHPPSDYGPLRVRLRDRKGADMNEWPERLRVQEFPEVAP